MSDDIPPAETPPATGVAEDRQPTRRRALMLGAVGATAIVSIRPALAQTTASVLTCEIPVPDPARSANYIAADGTLVPVGTAGAFPPARVPFKGEDVRRAMAGGRLPGMDSDRTRAYLQYIRRLQSGTSGFTCFASLQMPRG
ncbi:hypothetical protein [Sphingomonas sp. 28-63-12]|uniref:hypothetical protein n=1 Tax=Sphingomonas sp. 28-63-12 TaxID=1970434 RepID=UPI000BDB5EC9|nr:MAG: hypothetical protein B7Y47_13345 [Sphingomonas sp. 28-63-12]